MWSSFQGWRRKAGAITLVMSLILMAGWIRSFAMTDVLTRWTKEQKQGTLIAIQSRDGEIGWQTFRPSQVGFGNGWIAFPNVPRSPSDLKFHVIPYWAMTIPLTLLSAYLLLWKPVRMT